MIKFDPIVRMIPVKQINILNPRQRGRKKFAQITANILKLGLKKPITVAHVGGSNGDVRYNLACGQGRLEAYIELGQEEIPAIVVEGSREDLLLMSLAENLARRQHSAIHSMQEISLLKERGYNYAEIARKIELSKSFVHAILQLLAKGEEPLLQAVERGQLPITIAITIATSDDAAIQRSLQEAYERNDLRGKAMLRARRLIELVGHMARNRAVARERRPARRSPPKSCSRRSSKKPCGRR